METFLLIIMSLLVAVVISVLYEMYRKQKARKAYHDSGTYVDVDGTKLHYLKEGKGETTVVFESGLDFRGHLVWKKIQPEIAKFATTLSYDRAGILRSERGGKEKTAKNIAEDLWTLLDQANLPKPYILVGHSLAGLPFRYFVDKYPDDVAGVIFVDASSPELINRLPEKLQKKILPKIPPSWLTTVFFKTGIIRMLINKMLKKADNGIFLSDKAQINYYLENSILGTNNEMAEIVAMCDEVRAISSIGDIPLIIMAATKAEEKIKAHAEVVKISNTLSEESLTMSTNSKLIWADCGHYIQLEKPQLLIDAITEMVNKA